MSVTTPPKPQYQSHAPATHAGLDGEILSRETARMPDPPPDASRRSGEADRAAPIRSNESIRTNVSPADAAPPGARGAGWLALALWIEMIPVTMLVPVLKELVGDRYGAGTFWSHAFMSINMVGAVLAAPFCGLLADRLGRRRHLLIFAALLHALLLLGMSAAPTLAALFLFRFFEGAAHITIVSTIMALASASAPPAQRGRRMGLIGSALIFGTACGAPLGGRLGNVAPELVLIVGAGAAALVALLAALLIAESRHAAPQGRAGFSWALLRGNPGLKLAFALGFVDRLCVGMIVSSFVLFLAQVHTTTPGQRGMLLGLFLFPFALLCYPLGRLADRLGRRLPLLVGSFGFAALFAVYGLLPQAWLPGAMLLSGIVSALMFPATLALCADHSPPEHRAAAFALFNAAGSLGFLVGPLIGGSIQVLLNGAGPATLTGFQVTFLTGGIAVALCTMPVLRLTPRASPRLLAEPRP